MAVSMANCCEFRLTQHTATMLRLGLSERGITEIMGVAEHMARATAAAAAMRLGSNALHGVQPGTAL